MESWAEETCHLQQVEQLIAQIEQAQAHVSMRSCCHGGAAQILGKCLVQALGTKPKLLQQLLKGLRGRLDSTRRYLC
jgi:hypothetical protein